MDVQFYGANCLSISNKSTRIVVDDNLTDLGKKSVIKSGDVALFTNAVPSSVKDAKIIIDCPGEYEVSDVSIIGIPARAHTDEEGTLKATMFKITTNDLNILVTGHVYPEFSESQLESIGMVDVLFVPVGGHGYTLDSKGALMAIKEIEPKLVIPTNYEDKSLKYPVPQTSLSEALKEMSMEPKETLTKLKLRSGDLSEVTQIVVLETV